MKRHRPSDETVITSIMDEFRRPRIAEFGADLETRMETRQRIRPRLEARYGKRLVKEAWWRWS